MAYAPSKESDQPEHLPSLIRVSAVRMKKAWVLGYPLSTQRRLWSDWADAQADLGLRWAHSHFAGFVMRPLIVQILSALTGKLENIWSPMFAIQSHVVALTAPWEGFWRISGIGPFSSDIQNSSTYRNVIRKIQIGVKETTKNWIP